MHKYLELQCLHVNRQSEKSWVSVFLWIIENWCGEELSQRIIKGRFFLVVRLINYA